MQYVVFKLGPEKFAIETEKVQTITEKMKVTKVPKAPSHIKGLINLRGSIKPLINLGLLMDMNTGESCENIMILSLEDEEIGIEVDEVVEVLEVNQENIQKVADKSKGFIKGVMELDDQLVTFIEIDKILNI